MRLRNIHKYQYVQQRQGATTKACYACEASMLVSGLLSAAVPTDALTSWLQSQGITSAVTTLPRPWVTWTKGLAGRTRVLQPVKEGTVQLSIQSAIADERGRQLLWVSRHDHTLCSPHLSTQACYQKNCSPARLMPGICRMQPMSQAWHVHISELCFTAHAWPGHARDATPASGLLPIPSYNAPKRMSGAQP